MSATRINYHQVIRQANKIKDAGEDMSRLAKDNLDEIIDELPSKWEGDAASLYISKCENLKKEMKQLAQEIINIGIDIKHAADRIKEQDEAAQRAIMSNK